MPPRSIGRRLSAGSLTAPKPGRSDYAATRTAKVEPLPNLFVCAFIANAASFVLPISNPANLVLFGTRMPALSEWLRYFLLPSTAAIAATFVMLRISLRNSLLGGIDGSGGEPAVLTRNAAIVAAGIGMTAVVLLAASAFGLDLGMPTFGCGAVVTAR